MGRTGSALCLGILALFSCRPRAFHQNSVTASVPATAPAPSDHLSVLDCGAGGAPSSIYLQPVEAAPTKASWEGEGGGSSVVSSKLKMRLDVCTGHADSPVLRRVVLQEEGLARTFVVMSQTAGEVTWQRRSEGVVFQVPVKVVKVVGLAGAVGGNAEGFELSFPLYDIQEVRVRSLRMEDKFISAVGFYWTTTRAMPEVSLGRWTPGDPF